MISKTMYKTPEGKEVHITVDHTKNKIQNIEITGVEFQPDDALKKIEQELSGLDIDEQTIKEKLAGIIKKHKITILGTTEYSLTRAVIIACGITGPVI